ncbi:hypothetical protein V2H45_17680 [Tumidithrix elongata RA019]|uniref:Uncharacterized protein n=1 Tax=Tumidithrix elongata BACA0141 TaxID=2716417 RepID=A0AAW9Q3V2_9CYAN|nr:hypothetical protein [Tumidithrix elongata RA019]
MLKSLWRRNLQFVALTLFLAIATFTFSSSLLAQATSSPEVASPASEVVDADKDKSSECPEQSENGTAAAKEDCKKAPKVAPSSSASSQSPSAYDRNAMKKYDRELYGD